MGTLRLARTLLARGAAAAIVLVDERVVVVGEGAKRFGVEATVNGYSWRTSVTRMRGEFVVGLSRAVREAAGVRSGDTVTVELALDAAAREVELPEALARAFAADSEADGAYRQLSYTHREEYARWIDGAKREQTRQRRVAQALEELTEGNARA